MDPSSRVENSPDTRGRHRTERLAARHSTRRQVLGGLAVGIGSGFAAWCEDSGRAAEPAPDPCRDDLAINESTALIFSKEAPLAPAVGLRDARAVWTHLPGRPVGRVLIFLHGHNGYVTVDSAGRPRGPGLGRTRRRGPRGCLGQARGPAGLRPGPHGSAARSHGADRDGPGGEHARQRLILGEGARRPVRRPGTTGQHGQRLPRAPGLPPSARRPAVSAQGFRRPTRRDRRGGSRGRTGARADLPLRPFRSGPAAGRGRGIDADPARSGLADGSLAVRLHLLVEGGGVRPVLRPMEGGRASWRRPSRCGPIRLHLPTAHPDREGRRLPACRGRQGDRRQPGYARQGPLTDQLRQGGPPRTGKLRGLVSPHALAPRRDPHLLHPGMLETST